jgi:hypothetical protein
MSQPSHPIHPFSFPQNIPMALFRLKANKNDKKKKIVEY